MKRAGSADAPRWAWARDPRRLVIGLVWAGVVLACLWSGLTENLAMLRMRTLHAGGQWASVNRWFSGVPAPLPAEAIVRAIEGLPPGMPVVMVTPAGFEPGGSIYQAVAYLAAPRPTWVVACAEGGRPASIYPIEGAERPSGVLFVMAQPPARLSARPLAGVPNASLQLATLDAGIPWSELCSP